MANIFGFVIVALMLHGASAATYTVLDNSGWIVPGNDSVYRTWAASKNFKMGDTLVFNYPTGRHDVAEVSKAGYDACNGTTPIRLEMISPVRLNLTNGEHYYICTFEGHCLGGQKLAITVGNANGSPAPAPSSPPSPTPAPVPAPAPAPTNTPPQAPSPSMPSPPATPPPTNTPPQTPSPSMPSPPATPPPTNTPPQAPSPTTPSPNSPPTPPSADSPPTTPPSGSSSIAARGFFVALFAIVIAFLC